MKGAETPRRLKDCALKNPLTGCRIRAMRLHLLSHLRHDQESPLLV